MSTGVALVLTKLSSELLKTLRGCVNSFWTERHGGLRFSNKLQHNMDPTNERPSVVEDIIFNWLSFSCSHTVFPETTTMQMHQLRENLVTPRNRAMDTGVRGILRGPLVLDVGVKE